MIANHCHIFVIKERVTRSMQWSMSPLKNMADSTQRSKSQIKRSGHSVWIGRSTGGLHDRMFGPITSYQICWDLFIPKWPLPLAYKRRLARSPKVMPKILFRAPHIVIMPNIWLKHQRIFEHILNKASLQVPPSRDPFLLLAPESPMLDGFWHQQIREKA